MGLLIAKMRDRRDRRVCVRFEKKGGSKERFSPSFGNWLPGDEPELTFHSAEVELNVRHQGSFLRKCLTRDEVDRIVGIDAAMERAE